MMRHQFRSGIASQQPGLQRLVLGQALAEQLVHERDRRAQVVDRVKCAGYRLAFTIEPGHVSAGDDRFSLRRMNIHESMTRSAPMFMARLTGLF